MTNIRYYHDNFPNFDIFIQPFHSLHSKARNAILPSSLHPPT